MPSNSSFAQKAMASAARRKAKPIELMFNEKTFLYKETGNKIPVSEIHSDSEPTIKFKIDAKEIFTPHEVTLKRSEIVDRAMKRYGASESTVSRWVIDTLSPSGYGMYSNPNFV